MPEKPREFHRLKEHEILKQRLEKKLKDRNLTEEQKRKLFDLIRLRKGLLNEIEFLRIKENILSSKTKILVHLTDINNLQSIFEMGLKHGDYERHEIGWIDLSGGRSLGNAPNNFRYYLRSTEGHEVDVINEFFDSMNGIDRKEGYLRDSQFFEREYFGPLRKLIQHEGNMRAKITNIRGEEIKILREYYSKYAGGNKEFLNNKEVVKKLHEIIGRIIARDSYFTVHYGDYKQSAMNIGLLYPEDAHIRRDMDVSIVNPKAKPIGFFCPNSVNVPELLSIMFRNAKSIDDIVPVYGKGGEVLWPK